MKKVVCLIAILPLLLCGCSGKDQTNKTKMDTFSYAEDSAYYKDDPGIKQFGFVNTQRTEIKSAEQAIELAKKECKVKYDTVDVAFDANLKIYRVSFFKEDCDGGNQAVYINQEGITQLIICGE